MPATIATPPIDGVPRFLWWLGGPSSRISWPNPCLVNSLISTGVSRIDTVSAMPTAMRICLIRDRPRDQRVGQRAEPCRVRRLHQHHVAGAQFGAQQRQRGVGVGDHGGLTAPRPLHDRPVVHGAHRPPGSDDDESMTHLIAPPAGRCGRARKSRRRRVRPSRRAPPSCAARRPAPAVGHPGQRLQPGPHRVRVGVVRVVDDGHAVGAGARPACGAATPDPPPPAPRPPARRLAPHSSATAAAHSALDTWWSPCTASATSVCAAGGVQREARPGQLVERDVVRPDVRARRPRRPAPPAPPSGRPSRPPPRRRR